MKKLNLIIERLKKLNGFTLPNDYVSYVYSSGYLEIEIDNTYIVLFPIEELEKINNDYEVSIYAPSFFFIGSNGGGAGLAFNLNNGKLFSLPFIGMSDNDAVKVAESFSDFLHKLNKRDIEIY